MIKSGKIPFRYLNAKGGKNKSGPSFSPAGSLISYVFGKILHSGLCVFVPNQGARSMISGQVITIRLDENAWIELRKASIRPLEAFWKEASIFSLTIP
jgi:hypothetical protein